MLQQIIHRLLKRRHFWRYATFGEIAELYASRLLNVFAIRFVLVFVSVYLYKLDYDLVFIALFWAVYYLLKAVFSWPSAKLAAHFGPKHGLLYANFVFAAAMGFLFFTEQFGIWVLALWCVFHSFAGALNNLCYKIDFSKVKHAEHAGKEIGYMNIVERISGAASPLLGGIVASLFGPPAAMVLAGIFFLCSALPLLRTAEPTKLRQHLKFRGFPWRQTWRSYPAEAAIGLDIFASGTVWAIFIAAVVFAADGQEIYAKIGVLTSITFAVVLLASYLFGRLIDHRQGRLLLKSMVFINAFTHLVRPTVSSGLGVVTTNAANDMATTGYTMAFTRGEFDTADVTGFRIVYLALMEAALNFGAFLAALCLAWACWTFQTQSALSLFYVLTAGAVLLIATPRFGLYRR
ncbi:MAG TPA: MFS transporter [Candidatus Saccharibacteria bacterium]|nr:MFS transporter [Candidatus Saccharibacteria bacterium]HRK93825.1 MFS transporter [Candidatus Saccharibacteria bacterium]